MALGTIRGWRRGAEKCKRLTPRSGEVQKADDDERGSARSRHRGAEKCKQLMRTSRAVQTPGARQRVSAGNGEKWGHLSS